MESVYTLPLLILVAALLVLALLMWFIGTRRSRVRVSDETRSRVGEARLDQGERQASVVSEQIEQMVKQSLAAYPDLADIRFDFGTAEDGTIDIWLNDERYPDVEAIPDERVRTAVSEAVRKFNR